ncbi:baseplate J/gp47 family protein [Pedobacter sp. AW31-3R]|uniref:baseplate J/gp47 family protein n=1 Tax=Pedobacter sp. AW31-3R TaxID=3445781 RepID=UPI003F9ECFA2
MARTPEEIRAQMLAQKELQTELSALNSLSNTAIWRLWIFITVMTIYYFEVALDAYKASVQLIIDNNQYGTLTWWYNQIKGYQHGDLLSFINNVYKYPAADTSKQIIKYCSVTDNGGKVQIKVAKQSGNEPVVLTADEINGVVDYVSDIRPAGTQITVQSLAADLVRIKLNVYYNANGDINLIKPAVEAAVTNYLANIQFDGVLYLNRLIDAIQSVPAVVNDQVEILEAAAQGSGDPYQTFSSRYAAKSGYFKVDPDYPLSTQINYLT